MIWVGIGQCRWHDSVNLHIITKWAKLTYLSSLHLRRQSSHPKPCQSHFSLETSGINLIWRAKIRFETEKDQIKEVCYSLYSFVSNDKISLNRQKSMDFSINILIKSHIIWWFNKFTWFSPNFKFRNMPTQSCPGRLKFHKLSSHGLSTKPLSKTIFSSKIIFSRKLKQNSQMEDIVECCMIVSVFCMVTAKLAILYICSSGYFRWCFPWSCAMIWVVMWQN